MSQFLDSEPLFEQTDFENTQSNNDNVCLIFSELKVAEEEPFSTGMEEGRIPIGQTVGVVPKRKMISKSGTKIDLKKKHGGKDGGKRKNKRQVKAKPRSISQFLR